MYDRIGRSYAEHRQADYRIVSRLFDLLSLPAASTVADIGAGTGNYSQALANHGFRVEAIEPSAVMRQQAQSHHLISWRTGTAERIPLPDGSVDGVMCILSVHHFSSLSLSSREMARICRDGPIVILTFDPRTAASPWFALYFPSIWESTFSLFPSVTILGDELATLTSRRVNISPLLIPWNLEDRFMGAGWRRPEMYLDPDIRASMSGFALADQAAVADGLKRLSEDLESGSWQIQNANLTTQLEIDWGYRFLIAR